MREKLSQPEENLEDKELEEEPMKDIDSPEAEIEKNKNDEVTVSPEDIDFLSDTGFDWEGRKEVETDAGIMIEMPRSDGQSAFVKPDNFQTWVSHLRDERDLAKAKEELDNTFEGERDIKKEQSSEDLEEERVQAERLRTNLYDLAETVKKLYIGFSERDNDNFNPLIYPEDIGKLLASAQNLENIADNIKANEDYLSGAVSKITEVVQEIGNVNQRGVNEDEDSLNRISYLLKDVEDQCGTVLSVAGGIDKYDVIPLRMSVSKLLETAQDRGFYVRRKLEAFLDYNNS